MQPIFDAQLYNLEHGLSPPGERAHDVRTREFAADLAEFWSQRSRSRRSFKLWRRICSASYRRQRR